MKLNKTLQRMLSVLLLVCMLFSLSPRTAFAEGEEESTEENVVVAETSESEEESTGEDSEELEMEDMDPSTLGIKKLGEEPEEEDEIEEGEISVEPDTSLNETVRVSIFLDAPATLDAGYAAEGVGSNSGAISYRNTLKRNQEQMTASIESVLGHSLDVQWNLTLLVNAISAYVKVKEIPMIERLNGVASVQRETRYEVPEDGYGAQPNTSNTSSSMVGATDAWLAGYSGAGMRIAIIDTGIDTSHQSFDEDAFNHAIEEDAANGVSAALMTSADISAVASQLNAPGTYVSAKIPYGYNYVDRNTTITHLNDSEGEHGSHVAGIAAANRYIKSGSDYVEAASEVKVVGMAPDAQLLVMKVFGAGGGAYDSDYFAALEDAIVLGADAANLSLGSSEPGFTYSDGYQDVLNGLTSANNDKMVVTISAGNNGAAADHMDNGYLYADDVSMHTGGSPGSYINSLGTASADNIGETGEPLVYNGKNIYYTESESTGAAMNSIVGTYDFVYIDAFGAEQDYSAVNSVVSLNGKIVIVNRGSLSFYEKGNNAINYNPKAMLIANNTSGTISMALDDYTGTFPMVSITLADAELIKATATAGTTGDYTYYTGSITVTNTIHSEVTSSRENASVSDFSSWGVPGSLLMKPEITAPGGSIYSVYGTNKTKSGGTAGGSDQYELMSGTSMAAPHMAGLSAVAGQYVKANDSFATINAALKSGYSRRAIVQSLLMSTATPMKNYGLYLPTIQQGAGLVDVSAAVSASSVLMMGQYDDTLTAKTGQAADGKVKAEFGDDPDRAGVYSYSFTLYNITGTNLGFNLRTDLFTQDLFEYEDEAFMDYATTDLVYGSDYTVSYVWSGTTSIPVNPYDVDQDGDTDADDAQAVLDYLTGEVDGSALNLAVADADGDGSVTTYDAHLILNFEPGASTDGTVPANGSSTVSVTIALTDAGKSKLDYYPNGAYIEGFTYAACDTQTAEGVSLAHEHSIPLLGFYGNWTDPSMFDNTSYVDTLYETDKLPYSGNSLTNYMTMTYSGVSSKFTGNPYIVEEEFPADKLAFNATNTFGSIFYNLIRNAGTTGFAISLLDENHNITEVLSSSVVGNEVAGLYFSESEDSWQNAGTKFYTVGKTGDSYGLAEGDLFRIGFYAVPEYNAMMVNGDLTSDSAGILSNQNFQTVLENNMLGSGAFVGYDFTIDNTDPEIISAALNGNELTVTASDNLNLAYVAVLSLNGDIIYEEAAPGSEEYSITFDASDAIENANGYIAVFAADYAGNEVAKAVKVNDNTYEEKTVYVLTNELSVGEDYLIVNRSSDGNGVALGHSAATIATNNVAVKAGISETEDQPYIDSVDVAETSVWTTSSGITFKNGDYYLGRSRNNSTTLSAITSNQYNTWNWDGTNNRLSMTVSNKAYYLRYYNNSFSLNTAANSVYLYKKTIIRTEVDPYHPTSITLTPDSLDLYKGNETDVIAKVLPLTAEDRTVSWTSSDPNVVTVDANGHVRAIAAGTATITATSNANEKINAACSVKVTSINKNLNAAIWDEEGGVYFSSFNANNLPSWTKLHSDDKGKGIHSALMYSSSQLYAGTLDTSSASTEIYSVDRSTYELTEYGENYLWATDMAIGASDTTYADYIGFAYTFAYYLVAGPIAPEDDGEGGIYCGLPYAFVDCSEITGGSYFVGIAAKSRSRSGGTYYVLDENGTIWQTTLAYSNSEGFYFSTPTKVMETGIGTSFLYQSLYYDGTYLYWSHCDGDISELIIINPSTEAIYHAGDFGENVWPAAGLYVNGSVAPAAEGNEVMDDGAPTNPDLSGVRIQATRDELMTASIQNRFAQEAQRFASKIVKTEEPEAEEPTEEEEETTEESEVSEETEDAAEEETSEPEEESLLEESEESIEEPEESAIEPEESMDESDESIEEPEESSVEPEESIQEPEESADQPEDSVEETEESAKGSEEASETESDYTGSINAAGSSVPVKRIIRKAIFTNKAEITTTDDGTAQIRITEEEASHNGLYTLTYDPTQLTYLSTTSGASCKSIHVDEENGTVTFAFAAVSAFAANTEIATVSFTIKGNEGSTVTVDTKERNAQLNLSESEEVEIAGSVPVFKSKSLTLSGQIGLNFFMDIPEAYREGSYMTFSISGSGTTTERDDFDASFVSSNGKYFGFTCYINSVQMADTITAEFHYGENGEKTVSLEYSVAKYLSFFDEHASEYNAETLAMIHSIADYGHYAQPFLASFNGWTIGTDHAEMTKYYAESYDFDEIKNKVAQYKIVKTIEGSNVSKVTYKLWLDSETTVDVYLTVEEGTELTAECSFNGKTYEAEKQSDGRYRVRISGISAHHLGDTLTIAGTAGSDFTVTVSALSYVRSVLNSSAFDTDAKNAMASLYKYYEAVMNYRTNGN